MDTALNANSAIFVKNAYPPLMRLFGRAPSADHRFLLKLGRVFTCVFGVAIIASALYFAARPGDKGVFEIGFRLNAAISFPILLPGFWGLFFRKTPWWSAWAASGAALAVSVTGLVLHWPTAALFIGEGAVTLLAFLAARLGWAAAPAWQRETVTALFRRMHTPVDFKEEVGENADALLLRLVGKLALVLGGFFLLFLAFPQPHWYLWLGALGVGGSTFMVGLLLLWAARRLDRRAGGDDADDGTPPPSP